MNELTESINDYLDQNYLHLHSPAHCGDLNKRDLSEVGGLDDLNDPCGVLLNEQKKSAELFGAARSFFLLGGASIGMQAACIALQIYLENKQINKPVLVARNIHKSTLAGIILAGLDIVWFEPEWDAELGVYTRFKQENWQPETYSAIICTNPSYEGFYSKLTKVDIPIIIDEAHGAHYNFNAALPSTALESGADIAIQSWHKTLGSLTMTGFAHINYKSKIPAQYFEQALRMLQSTSPSYLLLESLCQTLAKYKQEGKQTIKQSLELAKELKSFCISNDDPTRALLQVKGWSGSELDINLMQNQINCEEVLNNSVLALINPYIKKTAIKKLKQVLENTKTKKSPQNKILRPEFGKQILKPRLAFFGKSKTLNLEKSIGKVAAELYTLCPPGIPLLVPGQIISETNIELIKMKTANKQTVRVHEN